MNFAVKGSKTWWNNVKSLLGESISKRHNNLTFIDDRWISCAEFTEEMNKFLLSFSKPVSFRPIDTAENDIPKVEEYEVYHYLTNIDTKKSTISEDYPSWITKHNADILSEPVADIINSILSESIFQFCADTFRKIGCSIRPGFYPFCRLPVRCGTHISVEMIKINWKVFRAGLVYKNYFTSHRRLR